MTYAGFGPRALSLFVDLVIWLPICPLFHSLFTGRSNTLAFLSYLLLGMFACAYPVVFHAQWGQTLGKMVSRIKVTRLSGERIGYRKATLRSSVDILFWVIYMTGVVYMFTSWEVPEWSSLSYRELHKLIRQQNIVSSLYYPIALVWTLSELIVLLLNKKRRALHDFIAGTVVIHTKPR